VYGKRFCVTSTTLNGKQTQKMFRFLAGPVCWWSTRSSRLCTATTLVEIKAPEFKIKPSERFYFWQVRSAVEGRRAHVLDGVASTDYKHLERKSNPVNVSESGSSILLEELICTAMDFVEFKAL
jgi:hypothetical protein